MSNFEEAVKLTLQFEGGFVNDPADPGGATKFGITQKDMPDRDISSITELDAQNYYREHYWKPLYSQILSQSVANKLFDMGVLAGVGTAVKLLQNALGVATDGAFGPNTLAVLNNAGDSVLGLYKNFLVQHFQHVVAVNPVLGKFLNGWLRRVNS